MDEGPKKPDPGDQEFEIVADGVGRIAGAGGSSGGTFAQFEGGGGGGGIFINDSGPVAQPGSSTLAPCPICGSPVQPDGGGTGYDAGGGGSANERIAVAGDSAPGVIYAQW